MEDKCIKKTVELFHITLAILVSFILVVFIYYIKNMEVLEKCSLKYSHTYAQKVELNDLPSFHSMKQMYEEDIPFVALSG